MKELTFTYQSDDGEEIFAKKWVEELEGKPRAIVQIAHGMAEHILRYDSFAKELMAQRIFVFGNDHRGHGMTGTAINGMGYFADEQGFEKVVGDMFILTSIIEKEFPNVPIILFGHSMGSFLSRRYIQLHGEKLAGVILSGTGGNPGVIGKLGKMIATHEMKKNGRRTPSLKLNKLSFGSYNKRFKPTRTPFDWLSRDDKEVDKYIEDPLCGEVFSIGFFCDLLAGIEKIHLSNEISAIPKNLPILFISGTMDPVGKQTKGVLNAYNQYKGAGIQDVTYLFYQDARHELLNELNKQEVIADVIKWISNRLK